MQALFVSGFFKAMQNIDPYVLYGHYLNDFYGAWCAGGEL